MMVKYYKFNYMDPEPPSGRKIIAIKSPSHVSPVPVPPSGRKIITIKSPAPPIVVPPIKTKLPTIVLQ